MSPQDELKDLEAFLSEPIPSEPGPLSTHLEDLAARASRATSLKALFGEQLRQAKMKVLIAGYPDYIKHVSEKKIYMESQVANELSAYEMISGFCVNIHERSISCGSLRKSYVNEQYHRSQG